MFNEIFLVCLSAAIGLLFAWAFRTLPGENWQILACIPGRKSPDGIWNGVNLTYYGFFNALAFVVATAVFLVLLGSIGITPLAAGIVILPVLAVGMWAARFIARWVEKKPHTFSVGAAAFACTIAAPWILILVNATAGRWLTFYLPMIETLAAMVIAYAFGEGIGRLACISFGCCYGKPLAQCPPAIRRIFRRRHFIFRGKTKKISYASQMEGVEMVPVQALTALICTLTGLLSFYLFLKGQAAVALILTLFATQIWRFVSEFLRADYRGNNRFSAYQLMSLGAMAYMLALVFAYPAQIRPIEPDLITGLHVLWHPGLILFLAALWMVSFLYTGKSQVTSSTIDIQVVEKKI